MSPTDRGGVEGYGRSILIGIVVLILSQGNIQGEGVERLQGGARAETAG